MRARRVEGASDIKVKVFWPLSIADDSVSRNKLHEATHNVRSEGSNDSPHADRCEITCQHFIISSAGLRSNLSIVMVHIE